MSAQPDQATHGRWPPTFPPPFAVAWGDDQYGLWAEFEVTAADGEAVRQRMRWIEPGQFLMGSPEDGLEPVRYEDEVPQHTVVLSSGFWLADTACTQALWAAIMDGDTPSRFKGPLRPVECVSWDDVQRFCKRLNVMVPGLHMTLPSEAQWEYACRAGTRTAFSFGDQVTAEQANFDGNYPLAGFAVSEFRQETLPAKALRPSNWGLYQMHGNVWEWCADGMREYSERKEVDPLGPVHANGPRVVRGGSWLYYARVLRSAYRSVNLPSVFHYDLGFRCARVHES